ncbi:hypothetical protein COOONC_27277 [Cooperia oncophora]
MERIAPLTASRPRVSQGHHHETADPVPIKPDHSEAKSLTADTPSRNEGTNTQNPLERSYVGKTPEPASTAQPVLHAQQSSRSCLSHRDPHQRKFQKWIEEKGRIDSFGTDGVKERLCKLVCMDLLTYDILTRPFTAAQLSVQDREHVRSLDFSITLKAKRIINPSVLLGSSYRRLFAQIYHQSYYRQADHHAYQTWTPSRERTPIFTTGASGFESEFREERDEWEKYWAMDATRTEEFQRAQAPSMHSTGRFGTIQRNEQLDKYGRDICIRQGINKPVITPHKTNDLVGHRFPRVRSVQEIKTRIDGFRKTVPGS